MSHHDKKVKPLMMHVAQPSGSYLKEYKKNLMEQLSKDQQLVFTAKKKWIRLNSY